MDDPSFVPQRDAAGRAHISGFSFEHSATWLVYPGLPIRSTVNETVGYVSTQKLQNRCANTPASGGMVSASCGTVLDALGGPHGILVRWVSLSLPGQRMAQAAGEAVTIGGRAARWSQTAADTECAKEGGTASISATVLIASDANQGLDNLLQAIACVTSRDDVPAVRAMLDSLQFDPLRTGDPSPTTTPALPGSAS